MQAADQLATSLKTLTVTVVNNGSVTSNPAGINCPPTCSFVFQTDTAVTLTAIGNGFTPGWSGGCSGTGACAVKMSADTTVTATFSATPPPATLTITPAGTGTGTVTCNVNGAGFGACAGQYPPGTSLVLHGAANNGSTFTGFSNGTGSISCTGTADCSVTLNADSMVTATFTVAVTNFSVSATTVSANGGTGQAQCTVNNGTAKGGQAGPCGSYQVGTQISIIPSSTNANFTGWTDGSGSGLTANCGGVTGPCNFQLTSDTSIKANFARPTLSVQVSGTGSVSSNPAGISNCTATSGTCSSPFDKGAQVTLTAGTGLTGWSGGGCSGTGTCTATVITDITVTANFGSVTSSTRWLFYENNVGTIGYVDPANPGAAPPTALTTTASGATTILAASWDSANAVYTNVTIPYVMYFSGGKLFRVSGAKSSGAPGSATNLPVQISNETAATTVCNTNQVGSAGASGKLFYELPGADNNCTTQNDNVTKWVGILDSATTPPTALASGLVLGATNSAGPGWVTDLSTGAATNVFLVDAANNNTLKLMNLNTNAITTIQTNVGDVRILAQNTTDRVFLRGDNVNNNIVYLYTVSTNSLVTLVTGASKLERGRPVGDGTNLYVAEQATGKLYNIPMNATGPSNVGTLLTSLGFPLGTPFGNDDVIVTTNDVFLQTDEPCTQPCDPLTQDKTGLYRVPKTGGAATAIVAHAAGTGVFNVFSVKNLLYYNHFFAPSVPQAVIIKEDGTSVFSSSTTCPGGCAGWAADIRSPSFAVKTGEQPVADAILSTFANSTFNGATFTAFDGPTGTQGANLGVVPATTPTLVFVFGEDFIDNATLLVAQQTGGAANTFLFFLDAKVPGSLTLVPTSPAGTWVPLFNGG